MDGVDQIMLAEALSDALLPLAIVGIVLATLAWILVTRMKIKAGYPLTGAWGQALRPAGGDTDRIALLTQENAQLRAELGSIKDRLATVERIVTDDGVRLSREIEGLRAPAN